MVHPDIIAVPAAEADDRPKQTFGFSEGVIPGAFDLGKHTLQYIEAVTETCKEQPFLVLKILKQDAYAYPCLVRYDIGVCPVIARVGKFTDARLHYFVYLFFGKLSCHIKPISA